MRELLRRHPPTPPELATRAAAILMLAGAALIAVTVALPPAAQGSDLLIVGLGGVAGLSGLILLRVRRAPEPVLGAVALVGTALITLATFEAGLIGTGAEDSGILYLWVCLYSFYFLRLGHALAQLTIVGFAYGGLLLAQAPPETVLNRWLTTVATLLVAGLLVARLRRSAGQMVLELSRRARHDPLTGALNRRALEERAALELVRSRRERTPTALIAADVDDLKALNDSFGHPAGDEVLRRVAQELRAETRVVDAVARIGGDEFAILLPGASAAETMRVAERVRRAARGHAGTGPGVTLSLGMASAEAGEATSLEELWAAADAAMYDVKRAGGDAVGIAPRGPDQPSRAALP